MPRPIAILLWLVVGTLVATEDTRLEVHQDGTDPLAYLRLELPVPPALEHADQPPDRLRARCRLAPGDDGPAGPRLLYPVAHLVTTDAGERRVVVHGRWPAADLPQGQLQATTELWWPGQQWDGGTRALPVEAGAAADGATLVRDWRTAWRAELARRCARLHDRELELLLHRRFFGSFPQRDATRWDDDELIGFLRAIVGIDDLRSAVPEGDDGHLVIQERTEAAPEPLLLPRVEAPADAPVTPETDAAWYIPRSCAALSFTDLGTMEQGLGAVVAGIESWSPGTWTRPAPVILEDQLIALGLDPQTRAQLRQTGTVRVTLAGWDPFFDAGTNLLAVLQAEHPLETPAGAPHHHRAADGRVLVLATGERLLRMALAGREQERSLAQDPHYAAARARLVARDGAEERAFLFLSDHWLTNFISPRWRILDARRREVDARIRLTELLRLVRAAELRSAEPVDLVALRADHHLEPDFLDWLLADLELVDGAVVHTGLGGIGDHPPIDELPFDRVTPAEHAAYEGFRRDYERRWRQMDPIALHVERSDDRHWRARLYVSPIGRRSDWAMLRNFVLPQKLKQRIASGPALAAGVAVTVNTTTLAPMLGGVRLPVTTTVQLLALDFASTSFRPGTWLEEARPQDRISWLRTPAAVLAPRVLFDSLAPMVVRGEQRATVERDIVELGVDLDAEGFPLLAWMPEVRSEVALGMQPAALRALRDADLDYVEDPVPSDVHAFLDLQAGYLLRRKLWQLAVKDRSIADWRRRARLERIAADLGLEDHAADPLRRLLEHGVFPRPGLPAAVSSQALPGLLEPGERGGRGWRSAAERFGDLPSPLLRLERLDGYISVEPDALLFETRFAFASGAVTGAAQSDAVAPATPEEPATTELDFDAAE